MSAARFQALGVAARGIRKAAVIGAGSMGGGIAAQFANAGVPVVLLDVAGDGPDRSAPAKAGLARQLKAGGFMHADAAALVRPGTAADDLALLSDADWVVEAVIEDPAAKRALYARLAGVLPAGAVLSSNTSTIPRADLAAGLPPDLAARFLITHFFNPPRILPLVELVGGPEVAPATLARIRAACETVLGKTAIGCFDTPGFIANRIGCYWLALAALEARRAGLTVEEADAAHAALGIPRTGVFGLLDLVGLDLIPQVWGSLMRALPPADELQAQDLPGDARIAGLLAAGACGRKTGAGFYRRAPDGGREALDLATGLWRPAAEPPELPGQGRDPRALLSAEGPVPAYARAVLAGVIAYAARHAPAIAADLAAVDAAMALGYGWRRGPFRLADLWGAGRAVAELEARGTPVPDLLRAAAASGGFYDAGDRGLDAAGRRLAAPAVPPALLDTARAAPAILASGAATLHDLGGGIACLELRSKMNSLGPAAFDAIERTLARGGRDFAALVIGNDDPRAFSVGADLAFLGACIERQDGAEIAAYVERGQELFLRLKYAPFPVVAAAHGLALGGGCELVLHADAVVAHAELNAGLPEVKVGLIPAWGGCTQLLLRAQRAAEGPKGPAASARRVFETIFAGRPSTSALEARAMGLLRAEDGIVMNRGHLLAAARDRAAALLPGYRPPEPAILACGGASARAGLLSTVRGETAAGRLTATDAAIAAELAGVLTGGAAAAPDEAAMMRLECQALLRLIRSAATLDRIDHMLRTGKPLRN